MKHKYNLSGMTCSGCHAKVQGLLSSVKGVKNVAINLSQGEAIIDMDAHVPTSALQKVLINYPKYQITEANQNHIEAADPGSLAEDAKSWLNTYKPILLIFGYILGTTILVEATNEPFNSIRAMEHFMAGFFLVFCFFKFLDLKAFAESYAMYDILAKKWLGWGYLYAFIEMTLGISFLVGFAPLVSNAVTFVVMSVSIVGVFQSVVNKRKIKCACLGAVFNLPMTTVTIIEDALMIVMSGVMLITLLK
jgi:copper chaperone CopZ